jgi:aerobic-type carbon monoxide dehydrogenase small subunit (CoxS/CutS family)
MTRPRTLLRNGVRVAVTAPDDTPLLAVVRGDLGIQSAARGCATMQCGSCRVLVEGEPVNACAVRLGDIADGARVEGYEDVEGHPAAVAAIAAFTAERATRCTLCVPSIGVTAVALARRALSGDHAAIDATLEGAACMCTGRGSLRRALLAPVATTPAAKTPTE